MPTLTYESVRDVTARVMAALGCPDDEAMIVAEALARANLAGHDSHGLIRVEQYAKLVRTGDIVPGAPTTVVREAACTALLDGGWNFGPVVARRALEVAIRKAREYGTGTVSVRNSNHLGRLGEYALMAAAEGMLCIGAVNNHGRGNLVAPFGGSDGRLSTNPITFACPGPERPILVDITTSVVAEGKVRLVKNAGKRVPEGWIIDNQGHPSTDPDDLYTDPRGAILPFGGAVGHKGFALGVMVDILSGALSGAGCSYSSTCRLGNAMFFSVTDIEKFVPLDEFLEQVGVLDRHVKASPPAPGFQEVLMPGEPELRQEELRRREGIRIDEETWRQFVECAGGLGVEVGELDT
jgi:hydroxycarboxylate dehydrogenase B